MPARAQGLIRDAESAARYVLGLEPQIHGVEGRARAALDPVGVVVIGDEREAQSRAPTAEKRATVVRDRKSTRLNSSHGYISYAGFCFKKKKEAYYRTYRVLMLECC